MTSGSNSNRGFRGTRGQGLQGGFTRGAFRARGGNHQYQDVPRNIHRNLVEELTPQACSGPDREDDTSICFMGETKPEEKFENKQEVLKFYIDSG